MNNGCKHMKIISVYCGWRNEYRIDPRAYEHYWTGGWNKAWKKIQALTGFDFVVFITARIDSIFVYSSAVHTYDFRMFTAVKFIVIINIINSNCHYHYSRDYNLLHFCRLNYYHNYLIQGNLLVIIINFITG